MSRYLNICTASWAVSVAWFNPIFHAFKVKEVMDWAMKLHKLISFLEFNHTHHALFSFFNWKLRNCSLFILLQKLDSPNRWLRGLKIEFIIISKRGRIIFLPSTLFASYPSLPIFPAFISYATTTNKYQKTDCGKN